MVNAKTTYQSCKNERFFSPCISMLDTALFCICQYFAESLLTTNYHFALCVWGVGGVFVRVHLHYLSII